MWNSASLSDSFCVSLLLLLLLQLVLCTDAELTKIVYDSIKIWTEIDRTPRICNCICMSVCVCVGTSTDRKEWKGFRLLPAYTFKCIQTSSSVDRSRKVKSQIVKKGRERTKTVKSNVSILSMDDVSVEVNEQGNLTSEEKNKDQRRRGYLETRWNTKSCGKRKTFSFVIDLSS